MINSTQTVLKILKLCAAAFLLIVVFNFFFERASKNAQADDIEQMVSAIETQIEESSTGGDEFMYPIQRRAAAEYSLVDKSQTDAEREEFLFLCAVSNAVGRAQRAQTIVNIGLDAKEAHPNTRFVIYLAADESLCSESRVIGTGYYVPDGNGWSGISSGEWTWLIRTSSMKVTAEQIEATLLYERNKARFIAEHGEWGDYGDPLDAFVEESLGRKPVYITAGMWNDDFVKQ